MRAWLVIIGLWSFVAFGDERLGTAVTPAERGTARGWKSGAGILLLGLGTAAGAMAVQFGLTSSDANRRLTGYYPTPSSAPTPAEAPDVKQLQTRRDQAQGLLVTHLVLAGASLGGAGLMLFLDTPTAVTEASVGLAPGPGSVAVVVSGRF